MDETAHIQGTNRISPEEHLKAHALVRKSWVKLGEIPKLRALQRLPDAAESERIRGLVRRMAAISAPDFGLSTVVMGKNFAPIQDTAKLEKALLIEEHLETHSTFRDLVKLGPTALPFLIESLDNVTPTRLVLRQNKRELIMCFDSELEGNPANPLEESVLSRNSRPAFGDRESTREYAVKIGDVCFLAIGQITGRAYSVARYQPSGFVILNCPTKNSQLRQLVSELWGSGNPHQHLLDSLLLDFATEGIFDGQSLTGWYLGSELRCAAAMRLLYYYPEESAHLVAGLLDRLDVSATRSAEEAMLREVKNGVYAAQLIEAVRWSRHPLIRESIRKLSDRASDQKIAELRR